MVTLADIQAARARIAPYLYPTPLEPVDGLGAATWLKLENANRTHSFKARGALNALLALPPDALARGIVTASSGNHAQGLAYAAHVVGARARILMPTHTPQRKVNGARRYGADVLLFGANYDETEAEARRLERSEGMTFVSPYNDPFVVAGGGTVGLELLDALPGIRRVLVPAGGSGLISGIGIALKAHDPTIEVIGVCSVSTPALYNFIHGGQLPQIWDTLAEALSGEIEAGSITFDLTRQVVDRVVLVAEETIAEAMRWLAYQAGWVVEGGGAVGVAALLSGALPTSDVPTAVVITGGNVDAETLRQVLTAG
ncbi:MAG: threonine/serine dehydratase [Anaerolineae bacterium]|nr:threonine/serine dehydratase [Anaerolineae bacterium]